ncbi:MAG: hypothetical protein AB8G99_08290 [Planctomycetaceae bacterium]
MRYIPIVSHQLPQPSSVMQRKVENLAADLLIENLELQLDESLRAYLPTGNTDGPALHIDDLTEISMIDHEGDPTFYQDRGRLRAGSEDTIVTCSRPVPGYEEYCTEQLGLGDPQWLRPADPHNSLHVAEAAWQDREVRRELTRRIRDGRLSYIHPHMGSKAVWQLAKLLHDASHRPIPVLAATPGLCRWANDKVQFTQTAKRLFGEGLVPMTLSAWNYANAAKHARAIAEQAEVVGLKVPDSAGSGGNVVLPSTKLRGKSLLEIERLLEKEFTAIGWTGNQPLLVSAWEEDVLNSPSAQLWIPADVDEPPVVEGVFVQATLGAEAKFVGNQPAQLPHALANEIVDRCWLLGRLFQLLGYVGRCSFDLILIGDSFQNSRIEFIECNGRWGGTSLPMTLMNRLFGDFAQQPYASHVCSIPGLNAISFRALVGDLGNDLYDSRTGNGRFILFNPGRMRELAGVSVIGLGETWEAAQVTAFTDFPKLVTQLLASQTA